MTPSYVDPFDSVLQSPLDHEGALEVMSTDSTQQLIGQTSATSFDMSTIVQSLVPLDPFGQAQNLVNPFISPVAMSPITGSSMTVSSTAPYGLLNQEMTMPRCEEWSFGPSSMHLPTHSQSIQTAKQRNESSARLPCTPSMAMYQFVDERWPNKQQTMNFPVREPSPPSAASSNMSSPPSATDCSTEKPKRRRHSAPCSTSTGRSSRRRESHQTSVASLVSLANNDPTNEFINGIEYITFMYSCNRVVKEYTIRADIHNVSIDDIPLSFRVPNTVYPRANVPRPEYEGNRWAYESCCNKLGWILAYLNRDELEGRRGLIQRAVDSYRNLHKEMKSRRVARLEKIQNGTLRKRRAKRASSVEY
ncbi:hypothetical protein EC973_004543 [Apophysomyces ossiformis]|uniref:DUF8032 domain-containing protein n=1 Tax=Apophysomyces ossiformis TaxID=679940 RepID=A0A8H7BKE0_9FUNG|nr:hypothetical protein EC973_004543 [Apophysomyces ossiformis]